MEYKRCPVCKSSVFADMGTCYSCMYRFGSNPELEQRSAAADGRDELFVQFLVELQRFLGDFVLNGKVRVDELGARG